MPQVAYVPPDNNLFLWNVSQNIIMSEQKPRYDPMLAAASGANISYFIESLPHGFDTLLVESGGTYEMQKVNAEDNFTTSVFAPKPEHKGRLPKTGY